MHAQCIRLHAISLIGCTYLSSYIKIYSCTIWSRRAPGYLTWLFQEVLWIHFFVIFSQEPNILELQVMWDLHFFVIFCQEPNILELQVMWHGIIYKNIFLYYLEPEGSWILDLVISRSPLDKHLGLWINAFVCIVFKINPRIYISLSGAPYFGAASYLKKMQSQGIRLHAISLIGCTYLASSIKNIFLYCLEPEGSQMPDLVFSRSPLDKYLGLCMPMSLFHQNKMTEDLIPTVDSTF